MHDVICILLRPLKPAKGGVGRQGQRIWEMPLGKRSRTFVILAVQAAKCITSFFMTGNTASIVCI